MANDVLFAVITISIIAAIILYLIISQKRGFEKLYTKFDELSNDLQELTKEIQDKQEEKSDTKEKIKKLNTTELGSRKIKVLDSSDFNFQVKAHDKRKLKNNFIKETRDSEEMDFGEKYLFNHFSNKITERNKKVEGIRKLK